MKINFLKKSVLCVVFPLFGSCTLAARQDWNIIFDIPNTLMEPDKVSYLKDVMGFSTLAYTLWDWKNPTALQEVVYKVLELQGAQKGKYITRDPEGRVLPQMLCDFLSSKYTADRTLNKALRHVEQLKEEKYFASNREEQLVNTLFHILFNPEKLASHMRTIAGASSFVQACASSCGHEHVYIIGNWDKASFAILLTAPQTKDLLDLFPRNNIYISGMTKKLLPNPAAIEDRLKFRKLDKDKAHCVFISGQPEHIEAAKDAGLCTVMVKDKNFSQARADLRTLGINL